MENKNKLEKMLVIEDNENHLTDAKNFFNGIKEVDVHYATTFVEAEKFLGEYERNEKFKVDGVITDLFFPIDHEYRKEINEGPNGLVVAATCQRVGMPYVICTAGWHHGHKNNWACYIHRAMNGPEMIDGGTYDRDESEYDYTKGDEVDHKDWSEAYRTLKEIIKSSSK
ncbi:hypothetical protein KAT36_01180 [Candidatus Pacearchaeota archaeon]|nr:hypothetical protein [Candidatus Pacearchaeota archaeon]